MARKRHKPEEIVAKLRQVEVLTAQGQSMADRAASEPSPCNQTIHMDGIQMGEAMNAISGRCNARLPSPPVEAAAR
jgi:hypothetical protein